MSKGSTSHSSTRRPRAKETGLTLRQKVPHDQEAVKIKHEAFLLTHLNWLVVIVGNASGRAIAIDSPGSSARNVSIINSGASGSSGQTDV